MKKTQKRLIIMIIISVLLIAAVVWIAIANKSLQINTITVKSKKLPESFDGYKIAHVSDVHNTELDKNNQQLIEGLKNISPDIIAITGDMLDTRRAGFDKSLYFAREAAKIAPCYFVAGNHEARSAEYAELKKGLLDAGIIILDDNSLKIEKDGQHIVLHGINDPLIKTANATGDSKTITKKRLAGLNFKTSDFNILLFHRPEMFDLYVNKGFDLVLSGHAHGGQFRLPFIGGLYAPNQGAFPKYDSGLYTQENTNMVVSRGVGKSIIPFRINNNPEIIIVELKTK